MTTQDPFARRQTLTKTTNRQVDNSLGEVSSAPNNAEAEAAKIAPYVPTSADDEEGYAKMLAILNQQKIDDARTGRVVTTGDRIPIVNNPAVTTVANPTAPPAPQPKAYETVQPILTEVPKADDDKNKDEEKRKPEIKDEDVLPLLDSILLRGYASDYFTIRGNKVTLRTQFYWEEYAIRAEVESRLTDNSLRLTADTLLQKYVLASCLESFGNNYFKPISQGTPAELHTSLQERVDFLDTLPTILVYYLNEKRIEFNDKVLYLSENFDRILKTF